MRLAAHARQPRVQAGSRTFFDTLTGVLPFLAAGSSSSWIGSGRFLDAVDAGAAAVFAAGVLKCCQGKRAGGRR